LKRVGPYVNGIAFFLERNEMIELKQDELSAVSGGLTAMEGAGLILGVASFAAGSPIVMGVAFGAAGGLFLAHVMASF
jgi:hypothetical protein